MPIYEYYCSECDKMFNILQKISEGVKTQCPDCQQNTLVKKISAPYFQLKGTGWYETDFKTKKAPASTSTENTNSNKDTKAETTKNTEKTKSTEKTTTNTTSSSTTSTTSSPTSSSTPTSSK